MPRHRRSGWHRMWPKRAFQDQKVLPHSVHGVGSVVSVCLTGAGVVSMRRSLERRFLRNEVEGVVVVVVGVVGGWNKCSPSSWLKGVGLGGAMASGGGGVGGGFGVGKVVSSMVLENGEMCMKKKMKWRS